MTHAAGTSNHYGKLAKVGLVWGFVKEGIRSLLFLPTSMVMARLLTPEEAGIAAAGAFFIQLASRLTQFGFGAALVRAKRVTPAHISSVFVMNLALGTGAWALLTLGSSTAAAFFRSPETAAILRVSAFTFFIMAFGSVPTALLSREMDYRKSATSEWIATVTECGITVLLAWKGFSYWSLVYGSLIGDSTRAVVRIFMTRWRPSLRFSRVAAMEMVSFGVGVYAKNLFDYASQNFDNLVVGRVLGVEALGYYDKAFSLMSRVVGRINLAGPSVSFRVFAVIHEEAERFRRAYRKVILSVTFFGYPVLTGMLVIGPQLIEVLFGRRWMSVTAPFQILCVAAMLRLLNTYASTATQAKGRIWSEVKRQAFFLTVLVLAVFGFSRWGIAGSAFGVLVATAVMTILFQTLVRRLANLAWADLLAPQVPALVCSAGVAVVIVIVRGAVRSALHDPSALLTLTACFVAASIYYIAFGLLAPFTELRMVVHETAQDLAPRFLAKRLEWLAPLPSRAVVASGQ